jgi:SAM-dependent methyltransferase
MSNVYSDETVMVDDSGVWMPEDLVAVLQVHIGNQPVWSIDPARDAELVDHGRRRAPWPIGLRKYLDGVAEVRVAEYVGGKQHFDETVHFGSSRNAVQIVDAAGHPLAVGKWGGLGRPFGSDWAHATELVDAVAELVARMSARTGLPTFLCFGGLLGAVRTGRLIGHDHDLDVGYLSEKNHPADVVMESFRVERALEAEGLATRRVSGNALKVGVPLSDGSVAQVDIFGGCYIEDTFYMLPAVCGTIARQAFTPLTTVELEGRLVSCPANPESVLALIYGADWRTPDPTFRFEVATSVSRRLQGWFRGERDHLSFWQSQHANVPMGETTPKPSSYAESVAEQLGAGSRVVEIGCGGGADALFFASQGHEVVAHDFDGSVIRRASKWSAELDLPVQFQPLNLYQLRVVLTHAALRRHTGPTDVVYARRLIETLNEDGRVNFWRFCRLVLRGSGRLFVEFASEQPEEDRPLGPGRHRRSLSMERVMNEIEGSGGAVERAEVIDDDTGTACRLTARWRQM